MPCNRPVLPDRCRPAHGPPPAWQDFLKRLRRHAWVVYAKRSFGGPQQVLDYLGRYTHKVAIANHRLAGVTADEVTFRYRDRSGQGKAKRKTMRLPGAEFLHRFLLHVLPPGFKRIRHYGLTASRCKQQKLAACREQLKVPPPPPAVAETPEAFVQRVTGRDLHRCPVCGEGLLLLLATLPRAAHPFRQALPPPATGPPPIALT